MRFLVGTEAKCGTVLDRLYSPVNVAKLSVVWRREKKDTARGRIICLENIACGMLGWAE